MTSTTFVAGDIVTFVGCNEVHPETKADSLRTYARTGRWLERLAVARNPATPADALELLAADSNLVIRTEARARLDALQRSKS